MFDTITRKAQRPRGRWPSVLGAATLQLVVIGAIFVSTVYVSGALPEPADMMSFVVPNAPAPPPPPPPPKVAEPEPVKPQPGPTPEAPAIVEPPPVAAPVEAPTAIAPETGREAEVWKAEAGFEKAATTGLTGGVAGAGVETAPPAPPPAPVRVGGSISAPKLTKRVEPEYPIAAQTAHIEGTVILEATVDEKGEVDAVKVLRSNPLLDQSAIAAVKQWKYAPLQLNGRATPFILTVTVSFGLGKKEQGK